MDSIIPYGPPRLVIFFVCFGAICGNTQGSLRGASPHLHDLSGPQAYDFGNEKFSTIHVV